MNDLKFGIKKEFLFLCSLFVFSFVIRLLFFVFFLHEGKRSWVCTDSVEYHSVAINIAQGNGILKDDGDFNFRRLPGYPIFLGICYKIFGTTDVKKPLFVQIVLSSFIPIIIFLLSLCFFPANLLLAKFSAIYFSLHTGLIVHSGLLLSESLFIAVFLLFLILFFAQVHLIFCKTKVFLNLSRIFVAGVFLGIASLVRPVGHYLLFISILLLLFSNFTVKEKFKSSLVLFLGWVLVVGWWLFRNFILTGYLFFHTLPGIHFLIYSAAYIDSDKQKCEYFQSKNKLLGEWNRQITEKEISEKRKLRDIECCKLAEQIAGQYILSNPIIFIKHSLIHIFKSCVGLHSAALICLDSGEWVNYNKNTTIWDKVKRILFPQRASFFLKFLVYLEILFLIFVFVGFGGFFVISFFDSELFCLSIKSVVFISLFLFVTLAYGCARLRLPIEPFLVILSCYFWVSFLKKFRIKV